MEFKKLEVKDERSWVKKLLESSHVRKSAVYIIVGAVVGALYFYFTEGRHLTEIPVSYFVKSALIGGFFGFFITNSPCARGRC